MFERLLERKYGMHFIGAEKSAVGAGSDTWFIDCREGKFVMKFPSESDINRPEQEPELCEFLEKRGIPVCSFLRDKSGNFLSEDGEGRRFTLQKFISGSCPDWNTATNDILDESAEMLGKIHAALKDYPPLPVGIGQDFFRFMTPERAAESYRWSLKIAQERGDRDIVEDLKWRLSFVENFPWERFDLDRLTVRNTHGDYFILFFNLPIDNVYRKIRRFCKAAWRRSRRKSRTILIPSKPPALTYRFLSGNQYIDVVYILIRN